MKISLVVIMFATVQTEVPSSWKGVLGGDREGGSISGAAAGGGDGGGAGEGDGSVEEVEEGGCAASGSGISASFLTRVITVVGGDTDSSGAADGGNGGEAGKGAGGGSNPAVGGNTGNTGGGGIDWSARGEACIDSNNAGGNLNVDGAAGDTVEDGGGVLGSCDLLGGDDLTGDDDDGVLSEEL
jgi:hypothetical protein